MTEEPKKTHKLECNEEWIFSIIDENDQRICFIHIGAIKGAFLAASPEGKDVLVIQLDGEKHIRNYPSREEAQKTLDFIYNQKRDYIRACVLDNEAAAKRSSYSIGIQKELMKTFKGHLGEHE